MFSLCTNVNELSVLINVSPTTEKDKTAEKKIAFNKKIYF